ncbi:uncharacterized protein LOC105232874 isoform X2 [Bactrocera dorsalis]|uniref:Uncharacterized protein LOC105232874 isoform X2 n=1 Tax=Bactrocera dorsalis TaxID=27457 RepID=A0A6I9VLE3_BACDO|nr:uncharacterized protein LOC105232874 isoform X2 [Bactrocera dorsalis]
MDNIKSTDITYSQLSSLDVEFISKNISKEYAFSIISKAIECSDITAGDVLNLWVKKLQKIYSYEHFCRTDWGILTLCCQNYFEKMALEMTCVVDDKTYNQLSCWLKESSEFLKSIHISDQKFNVTGMCVFFDTILDLTQKSCQFFEMNGKKSDLTSQIGWINFLHNISHKLLWDCLEIHGQISDTEYCAIFHYIKALCTGVANDKFIEIKIKIEAWKFVAKFTLKYGAYGKHYNEQLEEKLPIRILLRQAENSLLMIYKKELGEDDKYVDQYLRITAFYLEILYRITTVYKPSEFPEFKMFFEVLLLSMSPPSFLRGSSIFTCIEKHVFPGLSNILLLLYKNYEFQKLIANHIGGSDYCYEFIVTYIRCCITNKEDDYFERSAELNFEIFKRLFQRPDIFVNSVRFDEIMDMYATLVLLDSSGTLLSNMQQYVIKGNSALSFACTDVLILVSSCKERRAYELKDGLQLWVETNNRFAQFSSNYRRLNVERLIEHYITLCSGLDLEENIEHQFHHSINLQNNYSIFHCINNGSNTLDMKMLSSKAISKLSRLIEIFDRNAMSLKDYYKLVSHMYKLVKYKAEVPNCLQQKIAELLTNCGAKPSFQRLMSAGLLLMANNHTNEETELKIITFIEKNFQNGMYFPMLSFWLIIQCFRKQKANSIVRNIAEAIYNQVEIPDIIQVSTFEKVPKSSVNCAADFEFYANIENNVESAIRPTHVLRKRPRNDITFDGNEIGDTIQNIKQLLQKITMFSQKLTENDYAKLNKLCKDIKVITDRHY